jgi:hypothetical protein
VNATKDADAVLAHEAFGLDASKATASAEAKLVHRAVHASSEHPFDAR